MRVRRRSGLIRWRLVLAAVGTGVVAVALMGGYVSGAAAKSPAYGPGGDPPPTVALALPKGGPISPSLGDPKLIAVLSRIQRGYRSAPGVELTTRQSGTSSPRRFVIGLRGGKVNAEEFLGLRGLALVRRSTASRTLMRATGADCWRRLGKEDPRTLLNVGAPFPENGKIASSNARIVIETHDGFWGYLASHIVPTHTFYKSFLTIAFDRNNHVIRSIVVRAPDHRVMATQTVSRLKSAPRMIPTKPAC